MVTGHRYGHRLQVWVTKVWMVQVSMLHLFQSRCWFVSTCVHLHLCLRPLGSIHVNLFVSFLMIVFTQVCIKLFCFFVNSNSIFFDEFPSKSPQTLLDFKQISAHLRHISCHKDQPWSFVSVNVASHVPHTGLRYCHHVISQQSHVHLHCILIYVKCMVLHVNAMNGM